MPHYDKSLVWFRRDLRCDDHAALHQALEASRLVFCVFIFDSHILDRLLACGARADRRVEFIHSSLLSLDAALKKHGGALIVRHANPVAAIPELARELCIDAVFVNHDYEPDAIARDASVAQQLKSGGCAWHSYKDQVIWEKDEILTLSGKPYSIYTPYKNAWLNKFQPAAEYWDLSSLNPWDIRSMPGVLAAPGRISPIPSLKELGFETTDLSGLNMSPGMQGAQTLLDDFLPRMKNYRDRRDFPAIKGPSYLSVHLRFGTISIRELTRRALQAIASGEGGEGAMSWLSELIWRDFYFMILYHYPHVTQHAFRSEYDRIRWESGPEADNTFLAWCEGRTGYPLVDAAMLQLNQTGYMHNRLRMVTASFLIKHLGIDWRRGEQYFALKLNDFDLAANNGGWQWAASSGCDAQPYFRIFNPIRQSEKFDAEGKFIRRYLPQLAQLDARHIHAPWLLSEAERVKAGVVYNNNYPTPIVMHDQARRKTLARYAVVRKTTVHDPSV